MIEAEEKTVTDLSDSPSRVQVWKLFDRISHRYDLLNRLLSFNRDVKWRKDVVKHLGDSQDQAVLDLAAGTADLLITLCKESDKIRSGFGLDPAIKMMKIGREKLKKKDLTDRTLLIPGNAEDIPFRNNTMDAVTIAFGIRNLINVDKGLREMYRILKPGGRSIILEFSLPVNRLVRKTYLVYFRYILPWIGSIISGNKYAYNYLNRTVETFPYGNDFLKIMEKNGFINLKSSVLTLGVATIYIGEKA